MVNRKKARGKMSKYVTIKEEDILKGVERYYPGKSIGERALIHHSF